MPIHRPAVAPDLSIRVLTVNTHKGFALLNRRFILHELRDAVRLVGADLVFLQEVQGIHTAHASRFANWPEAPQYEFLADELWPQFAYGRNAVYPDGDHGNALLSKHPILAWQNHDVSVEGEEARGLLHCTIAVPGTTGPLHAICVHLGLKAADRARQLDHLCDKVSALVPPEAPLVVAGDFNDWRRAAHQILEQRLGLREVYLTANGRAARTFPAGFPLLELDRIYARNTRAQTPFPLPRAPWSRLSDHAPLAAEIVL